MLRNNPAHQRKCGRRRSKKSNKQRHREYKKAVLQQKPKNFRQAKVQRTPYGFLRQPLSSLHFPRNQATRPSAV